MHAGLDMEVDNRPRVVEYKENILDELRGKRFRIDGEIV